MIGVPRDILDSAERVADHMFDTIAELVKWGVTERRRLACWRAVVLAEVIEAVNARRISRGKRPRRMPLRSWQLIRAEAECEANKRMNPELAIVCKAVAYRTAVLKTRGYV